MDIPDANATLAEHTASWLENERSIPVEVAVRCGVVTINGRPAFEYRRDGKLQYRKVRIDQGDGEKSFSRDRKGVETCLFLEHVLQEDPDLSSPLVICEGEIDALSLVAAGVSNVVSVPDGAQLDALGEGKIDPTDDKAFGWLWQDGQLKPHLSQFERVIIASDSDRKGRILREELAVRFERWRCDYVSFPHDCKDPNEVLVKHGAEALYHLVRDAKPIVPNTLVRFGDLPITGTGEVFGTGFKGLDDGLKCGIMPPELVVITGAPGSGKALALDTEVPTPSGWTTMGAINVGDTVYGADGRPCRVVNATDVMHGRDCFEIVFSDGSKVVADADHQWLTSTDASRKSELRARRRGTKSLQPRGTDQSHKRVRPCVVTTRQIAATLHRSDGGSNHAVDLCSPVSGTASILPVDPYVLGAWLGNGRSADGGVCLFDDEQVQHFMKAANGADVRTWSDGATRSIIGLKAKLDQMGLLYNKRIPAPYLRASVEQRMAMLQGLMDTDGYCAPESRLCEFCSVTEALARDTWELACSLGLKATLNVGRATLNGRDCGPKYRVMFTAPDFLVFRLARKMVNQKIGNGNRTGRRYIVACSPVPSVPVRCIEVDSVDHLFVITRSHIPTHNSEFAVSLGANLANYHDLPGAILQFEDRTQRVSETLIRYAMSNVAQIDTREKAREWINRWFRTIEPEQNIANDVDYDLDWLKATLREARTRHGCRWVILDPWNELDHMWDRSMNEAHYINDALRKIKRIGRALGLIIMIVVHPSKEGGRDKDITQRDLYDIAGAAAWANKADHGFIVHRPDHSKADVYVKMAKSKDHLTMGVPGIVRMVYVPTSVKYRFVGMGV